MMGSPCLPGRGGCAGGVEGDGHRTNHSFGPQLPPTRANGPTSIVRTIGAFAAVAFFVACEGGGPAAPTTPPVVTAPPPAAVSVVFEPTTARVGEVITNTYELSRALDRAVDVWTEVTPPAGDRYESGPLTFPAGQTVLVFSTGYLGEQHVGDWAMRIMGERLAGRRRARQPVVRRLVRSAVNLVSSPRSSMHNSSASSGEKRANLLPLRRANYVTHFGDGTLGNCDRRRNHVLTNLVRVLYGRRASAG